MVTIEAREILAVQSIIAEPGDYLLEVFGVIVGVRSGNQLLKRTKSESAPAPSVPQAKAKGKGKKALPRSRRAGAIAKDLILGEIKANPRTATDIGQALGLTHGAVAWHLKNLEKDGLVKCENKSKPYYWRLPKKEVQHEAIQDN